MGKKRDLASCMWARVTFTELQFPMSLWERHDLFKWFESPFIVALSMGPWNWCLQCARETIASIFPASAFILSPRFPLQMAEYKRAMFQDDEAPDAAADGSTSPDGVEVRRVGPCKDSGLACITSHSVPRMLFGICTSSQGGCCASCCSAMEFILNS